MFAPHSSRLIPYRMKAPLRCLSREGPRPAAGGGGLTDMPYQIRAATSNSVAAPCPAPASCVTTSRPPAKNAAMNQFVIAPLALVILIVSLSMAKPPEFVAHRGESHDAPENTLASYKLAWERGDDAAETDIHLTKDGKLIVSHDPDTGRLSAGKTKLVIKEHTADDLRKLDMGSFKGPSFADQKLPLLDELLAIIPPGKRLFIEVKIGPEA